MALRGARAPTSSPSQRDQHAAAFKPLRNLLGASSANGGFDMSQTSRQLDGPVLAPCAAANVDVAALPTQP